MILAVTCSVEKRFSQSRDFVVKSRCALCIKKITYICLLFCESIAVKYVYKNGRTEA